MTNPPGNSPEESREAEGMFATAMRLVSDRPPPDDVQRAVSLLEEALAKGYAKAGVRLAAYHAMAANATGDPQQWDQAFDFLERAAEQGSRGRGQATSAARRQFSRRSGHARRTRPLA